MMYWPIDEPKLVTSMVVVTSLGRHTSGVLLVKVIANYSSFRTARGIRTLTTQGLSLLPLPIGLERHVPGIEPGLGRGVLGR